MVLGSHLQNNISPLLTTRMNGFSTQQAEPEGHTSLTRQDRAPTTGRVVKALIYHPMLPQLIQSGAFATCTHPPLFAALFGKKPASKPPLGCPSAS